MRILFCALLLAGCDDSLPAASFIDKLRVLAMQAEPPEVPPGTPSTVTVTAVEPIVSQADGGKSPIDAMWLVCGQPPGALQASPCGVDLTTIPPDCATHPSAPVCLLGSGLSATYTPDASFVGADGTGSVLLTVVVADSDGGAIGCLSDIQQNNGLPTQPDRCVVAFKQLAINANPGAVLNQNPLLSGLTLAPKDGPAASLTDGTATFPVGTGPSDPTLILDVTRAAGSAELNDQGDYEALTISWYTTSGQIDGGRSAFVPAGCAAASDCPTKMPSLDTTTNWIVPKADQLAATTAADQKVEFWAVVRDDRGGVSILSGTATPQ